MVLLLFKREFPSYKDALFQVALKLDGYFWRGRYLNAVIVLPLSNYYPHLEKVIFTNLSDLYPRMFFCQVRLKCLFEMGSVFLEKMYVILSMYLNHVMLKSLKLGWNLILRTSKWDVCNSVQFIQWYPRHGFDIFILASLVFRFSPHSIFLQSYGDVTLAVLYLLRHRTSVLKVTSDDTLTSAPVTKRLAVELVLSFLQLRYVAAGIQTPNLPQARKTL